jgi:hypothetical protein
MNAAKIEPMIIEHPGVPGKLRSQTLDEYMAALIPEHPARSELSQLRAMALEGMKSANALAEALIKIQELESAISTLSAKAAMEIKEPLPEKPLCFDENLSLKSAVQTVKQLSGVKAPCPYCGKEVSVVTGGWKSHYRHNHSDQPFIAPPQ